MDAGFIDRLISGDTLYKAFEKVCYRRREYSCNNDIWELRYNWKVLKPEIVEELNSGTYRFDCVKEVVIDGQMYNIWAARDAVVIEALIMLLKDRYNAIESCTSYPLKDRGGVKVAADRVFSGARKYKYFF